MPHLPPAIDLTLHPGRRRHDVHPVDVDLRVVILLGTALWTVAAAVFGALAVFTEVEVASRLGVCAAGLVLGLLGLVWEHTNRRRYRSPDVVDAGDSDAPEP